MNRLKEKRQLLTVAAALFLLAAIPLTIYLARQTQVFKPKAVGAPTLNFLSGQNGTILSGNPPQTSHQNDNWIRVSWNGGGGGVTPSPTPTGSGGGGSTGSCNFTGPNQLTVGQTGAYTLSPAPNCPLGTTSLCSSSWTVYKPDAATGAAVTISVQDSNNLAPSSFQFTPQAGGSYQVNYSMTQLGSNISCNESVNVAGSSTNGCTACAADLNNNGVVEGSNPFTDFNSAADGILAGTCQGLFGGLWSFSNPNPSITQNNEVPYYTSICQKLDYNHNGVIDTEEVSCVAAQNGNRCTQ